MAKIMLVEDDNNLREIYEARLLAEGYEIVSAEDGEQALAIAVKEKPDLIISDVMMPKISGFDMLDILRSTPETRDTKVIMMTALSQAEDKTRADKLGADRYLVKSQVTLEDVAKVAKEVLDGESAIPPVAAVPATPVPPAPTPTPVAPSPVSVAPPDAVSPSPVPDTTVAAPVAEPATTPAPAPTPPVPTAQTNDQAQVTPAAQTTASEEQAVEDQINQFVSSLPADPPAVVAPAGPTTPAVDPTAVTPAPDTAVAAPAVAPVPASTSDPTAAAAAPVHIAITEPPTEPATDPTAAAAENAAKMVQAANELLHETESTPNDTKSASPTTAPGKKVIQPLNDVSGNSGPDLDALLAKEEAKEQALAAVPPTDTAANPQPPTPPTENEDPNNIAL